MAAPFYYSHAPVLTTPLDNYDDELALVAEFLRSPADRPFTVVGDSSRLARRFVRWALDTELSSSDEAVEVGWLLLGAGQDRAALVQEALDVAVAAWSRQVLEGRLRNRVLHETTESLSIDRLVPILRKRFATSFDTPLVLVVDGSLAHSPRDLRSIGGMDLLEHLHRCSGRTQFHGLALARTSDQIEADMRVSGGMVRVKKIGSMAHGVPAAEQTTSPSLFQGEPLDLLKRFSAVDAKAEREVVRYFEKYFTKSDEDIRLFNETNVLQAMEDAGGYCLSDASRSLLGRAGRSHGPTEPAYDTSVMSGKILSFQPLAALQSVPHHAISELQAHADYILDTFANIFAGRILRDVQGVRRLVDEIRASKAWPPTQIQEENLVRTRTVLSYGSQAVLLDDGPFGADLFKALEPVTEAYADSLFQILVDRREAEAAAARAHYNLGYVYDRMPDRPKARVSIDRNAITRRVIDKLQTAASGATFEDLKRRYHRAWYLYDDNARSEAAREMAAVADTRWRHALDPAETEMNARVDALECAFLGLAMDPDLPLSHDVETEVRRFLHATAAFPGLSELREWLREGSERTGPLESVPPEAVPNERVATVYFNYFDLFPALYTAQKLLQVLGFAIRYRPVDRPDSAGQGPATEIDLHGPDASGLVVIMGAPDSPEPIGRQIAKLDSLFSQLYQANIAADFSDPVMERKSGPRIVGMAGSGLGTPRRHWENALTKGLFAEPSERRLMSDILDPAVLAEIFRTAQNTTVMRVVDGVLSGVRERLRRRGVTPQDAELSSLGARLRHLSEQGANTDVTADTVEKTLKLDELSLSARRALLDALQPAELVDILKKSVEEARDLSDDPEQIRNLANVLEKLTRSCAARSRSVGERKKFEELDRNIMSIRSKIDDAVRTYHSGGELQTTDINDTAIRLRRAAEHFQGLLDPTASENP